jgi:hypothetical protein
MVKWLQSNTAYSVLRGAYWKTELRGAGKRAGTELHPSRARAGTELRLTFARLCSALLAIARLLAGSFFSQEYRAKQNSGRLGFLPKNGAKPFAFRRFPSLSVASQPKRFFNHEWTPNRASPEFQVPSSKFQAGTRRTLVRLCPRKSAKVPLCPPFARGTFFARAKGRVDCGIQKPRDQGCFLLQYGAVQS